MHFDPAIAAAGLLVGLLVGLTGMGGGALMTPLLVLVFKVDPLAAVSSDLVAALVMKPVGGAVHARRGTVNRRLVAWLVAGSVPAAFAGSLALKLLGAGESLATHLSTLLGAVLLIAAAAIPAKAWLTRHHPTDRGTDELAVKRIPTLMVGIVGGLVVGLTSVGSGSLMMVALLLLYPTLTAKELVGTDLVQAIPLVASAALGHMLFGEVSLGLTTSLIIGAVPGVYVGARLSSSAPDGLLRGVLVVVLSASGLKLLGAPSTIAAGAGGAIAVAGLARIVVGQARRRSVASGRVSVDEEGRSLVEVGDHLALDL